MMRVEIYNRGLNWTEIRKMITMQRFELFSNAFSLLVLHAIVGFKHRRGGKGSQTMQWIDQ